AATSVKVGYRQASYMKKPRRNVGFFFVFRKHDAKTCRASLHFAMEVSRGIDVYLPKSLIIINY
ncbi:MAG: hypothetical protein V4484_13095, partial [Pseudomonadota bacterium]